MENPNKNITNYIKSLLLYHNVGIENKLLKNESRLQQESLTWSLGKKGVLKRFRNTGDIMDHNL
jgi:hypothetical protein